MPLEEYTRACRAECVSLMGCVEADDSLDTEGEEWFGNHCWASHTFGKSVAFAGYLWMECSQIQGVE